MGMWNVERGTNLLDTGAHFYDTYETKDGEYVSLGSIEPQFYAELIEKSGLAGEKLPHQMSRDDWPAMKEKLPSSDCAKSPLGASACTRSPRTLTFSPPSHRSAGIKLARTVGSAPARNSNDTTAM